ncbi:MAG: hypothetical protein QM723_10210 [Myxococcaceae bacterium]
MKTAPDNPVSNQLGPGITDAQIVAAVEHSGYPLQTVVANTLRTEFGIHEEWSYLDGRSNELRSLDMVASRRLFDWKQHPRLRPTLNLLIECKQSNLPFIFFRAQQVPGSGFEFPTICGLAGDTIEIKSDDDRSTWTLSYPHALDLHSDPFLVQPPQCRTFSKCVRKGSELELSGSDAYNSIVMPLIKGLRHFIAREKPVSTAVYFDAHIALGLAVVDAPMIAVDITPSGAEFEAAPWIRVLRHEYESDTEKVDRDRMWTLDVVHKDFLSKYISNFAKPFAERVAAKILSHQKELADGKAFASGMGADPWAPIEPRLKPRSLLRSLRQRSSRKS